MASDSVTVADNEEPAPCDLKTCLLTPLLNVIRDTPQHEKYITFPIAYARDSESRHRELAALILAYVISNMDRGTPMLDYARGAFDVALRELDPESDETVPCTWTASVHHSAIAATKHAYAKHVFPNRQLLEQYHPRCMLVDGPGAVSTGTEERQLLGDSESPLGYIEPMGPMLLSVDVPVPYMAAVARALLEPCEARRFIHLGCMLYDAHNLTRGRYDGWRHARKLDVSRSLDALDW